MNTEEPLTKELAQKFMAIKGEIRGMGIKFDWDVIRQWKGDGGIRKLEEKMADLGYPLKYDEIGTAGFYPIGYDAVSLLAMKEVFGFNDGDYERLGEAAFKLSLVLRIVLKYFVSLPMIISQASKMWSNYYTIGSIEAAEVNEKQKYVIWRIKDFAIHPVYCPCIVGYLSAIGKVVLGSSSTVQETKCIFKGDAYHELLAKW